MALSPNNVKFKNTSVIINYITNNNFIITTYITDLTLTKGENNIYIVLNYKPIKIWKHDTSALQKIDQYICLVKNYNILGKSVESPPNINYFNEYTITYVSGSENNKEIFKILSNIENRNKHFVLHLHSKTINTFSCRMGFTFEHDLPCSARYGIPGVIVKNSRIIRRDLFVILIESFIKKININYDIIKPIYINFTDAKNLVKRSKKKKFLGMCTGVPIYEMEDICSYTALYKGETIMSTYIFNIDTNNTLVNEMFGLQGIAMKFSKDITYKSKCNKILYLPIRVCV